MLKIEEVYLKSLKIIKELKIKSAKEYMKLVKRHSILNINSLRYMSQGKQFSEIIKIARELK